MVKGLRKKRNCLHIIDMAKNKTVLQPLSFPLGKEAVGSQTISSNGLVEILSLLSLSFGGQAVSSATLYMTGQDG